MKVVFNTRNRESAASVFYLEDFCCNEGVSSFDWDDYLVGFKVTLVSLGIIIRSGDINMDCRTFLNKYVQV